MRAAAGAAARDRGPATGDQRAGPGRRPRPRPRPQGQPTPGARPRRRFGPRAARRSRRVHARHQRARGAPRGSAPRTGSRARAARQERRDLLVVGAAARRTPPRGARAAASWPGEGAGREQAHRAPQRRCSKDHARTLQPREPLPQRCTARCRLLFTVPRLMPSESGDLLQAHLLVVAQHEDRALRLGQAAQRAARCARRSRAEEPGARARARGASASWWSPSSSGLTRPAGACCAGSGRWTG